MSTVLFTLIFLVVLAAALYSRLPLTIVLMTSTVAYMTSLTPHGEPLNSILLLVRVPAMTITTFGSDLLGLGAPYVAGMALIVTLVLDIALTGALGLRR